MATNTKYMTTTNVPGKKLDWIPILSYALLFMFPLSLLFVLISPTDVNLAFSQRIFYFHLPANIMCFLSFLVYFIGGIAYWRTRQRKWDIVMVSSLELGVFFSFIGIVTGSIWARYAWNTFWTWDPRLTTVTIMLVVYLSGLMLRNATDDPSRKASLTAAFGVIGFIDVPLVYFSTRWFPRGLHPVIFGDNGNAIGLEGFMIVTMLTCMVTMGLLFTYFLIQRIRLEQMRDDVAALFYAQEGEEY
ncbi:MAG: cytochrome c biogenesis protein CcsA [Chloroflexota bacterium]|nr:cytochrome c biogenesis protein CcsA [Chloroflexota bacterium]